MSVSDTTLAWLGCGFWDLVRVPLLVTWLRGIIGISWLGRTRMSRGLVYELGWANQGASFRGVFTLARLLALTWKRGMVDVRGSSGRYFVCRCVCCTRIPRCALFNAFPSAPAVSEFQLRSSSVVFARCCHQHVTQASPLRNGAESSGSSSLPSSSATGLCSPRQQGCGSS